MNSGKLIAIEHRSGNGMGRAIKLTFASTLMLVMSTSIGAAQINSGGFTLEVPNPHGFTAITPKMTGIYDAQTKYWPESTVHYLTFIRDSEIPIAVRGEIPDMDRRLVVTSVDEVDGKNIRKSDFAALKTHFKTQSEQLAKQMNQEIPSAMAKQSERMFGQSGANLTIDMPKFRQYPPHDETERSIAYSAMNTYELKGTDGKSTYSEVTMTITWLHVRGRALLLNVYGEKEALNWTREASKQWTNAILAENPPDEKSNEVENSQKQNGGIDWVRVVIYGLFSAAIWGAIDVIRMKLGHRSKKK